MFSLILATINRTTELKIFLDSLLQQTFSDFEVIIADQNEDNRLLEIVSSYKSFFKIIHIRTPKGLSRSRNIALKYSSGDYLAFPDDDCSYSPDLLKRVASFFNNNNDCDGLSVRWSNTDVNGPNPMPEKKSCFITKNNYQGIICSTTIFVRSSLFNEIGNFEVGMGLGSGTVFTGAEDYEFVLRALHYGYKFYFESDWEGFHPYSTSGNNIVSDYRRQRIIGDGAAKYVFYKRYLGISKFYMSSFKHALGVGFNFIKLNKEGYIGHLYRLKGMMLGKRHYKKVLGQLK